MNHFARITLEDWRQFATVDIDLSRQITILTGQNGTGKTTILNLLSSHFGWHANLVSTPFLSKRDAKQFWSDVRKTRAVELEDSENEQENVGEIHYDNGKHCQLATTTFVTAQYRLKYANRMSVEGLHIPSHQPPAAYHQVSQIPTDPATAQQHYQNFQSLLQQTSGRVQNPGIALKQSIISLALFGYGNEAVQPNPEFKNMFEEFQRILRQVLPHEIGFERIEVRMPEVVLVTQTGDFSLDAMSGGISALLGIAWQIHMYGATVDKCTVTIDEPENHLHPSMQRSLLPSLAKAFPNYRLILATHSPYIVSSHPESSVYGLLFSDDNRVTSSKLDVADLSGTPNRILRDILDVPSNLPIWVEDRIHTVIREHANAPEAERAEQIMKCLREIGLTDAIPEYQAEDADAQPE